MRRMPIWHHLSPRGGCLTAKQAERQVEEQDQKRKRKRQDR